MGTSAAIGIGTSSQHRRRWGENEAQHGVTKPRTAPEGFRLLDVVIRDAAAVLKHRAGEGEDYRDALLVLTLALTGMKSDIV
ncbi:hypothetical protein CALCODRAFT_495547 [Calocera cornea HHB12733]|uniref:Uncharacterized protein n=1 Tax=Calocera cornea HHB12733 TaxID=1353952 RepID=A0A165GCI9_9BASI|nr:hypothetical protein CALCODRAFT_495547 [Calocera cornea HHB12733]